MRMWVVAGCMLVLFGCYGPVDITYHQPARYKGDRDPLRERQATPQQQQLLQARFDLGQTDR